MWNLKGSFFLKLIPVDGQKLHLKKSLILLKIKNQEPLKKSRTKVVKVESLKNISSTDKIQEQFKDFKHRWLPCNL